MTEPPPEQPKSASLTSPADATKLERLRRKARRLQNAMRFAQQWVLLYVSFWCIFIVMNLSIRDASFFIVHGILVFLSLLSIGVFYALQGFWRGTIRTLINIAEVETVAALVESLERMTEGKFAQEMLMGLLPRLNASEAHLLTPRHHYFLNRYLNSSDDSPNVALIRFTLATLKAYEQIGGKEDLPTVERLAKGEGYAKRNKEVRTAAQECLPYLQARSEQQDARQMLLRASQSAADSPATLLRPASAFDETAPRQLLRPSASEPLE